MIKTFHLTKQYNGRGGFEDISLSVTEGEVFSFLGKNGAGKSTFLRTLLGLLHSDTGEGYLLGRPVGHHESRREIGYLPELFSYPEWITGRELLVAQGKLYGMTDQRIKERIPEILRLIGMDGHENKKIREFSKGMKQRIGLGCAVFPDVRLVFLDEPTSALDPVGRKHVRDIILHLKAQGCTVFLNTHLLNEAEMVSDRVGIIDRGRLKTVGALRELTISPVTVRCENLSEKVLTWIEQTCGAVQITEQGFEVFINEDNVPELTAEMVRNGTRVFEVRRKENMLERLFLTTVGEEDKR